MFFAILRQVVCLSLIKTCLASIGDRSYAFKECLSTCEGNCDPLKFALQQSFHMKLLSWDCHEECKYNCMWSTIDKFKIANLSIPQFYGKWPFARFLGMQEPASVLFSILNGVTVFIGFSKFYRVVPAFAPMYKVVVFHFFLAENAWFWSTIYHCRDFPFTEKLDYFCATSLVLFSLYFCIYRWSFNLSHRKHNFIRWFVGNVLVLTYFGHISYLSFVKFDYGYNMLFNATLGIMSCLLCIFYWLCNRHKLSYIWKLPTTSVLTCLLLGLEILDFPPYLWILDAHSLWHFFTIPLPLLLYSFIIDDQLYLVNFSLL